MPYEITWIKDRQAIELTVSGLFNEAEISRMVDDLITYEASAEGSLYMLIDGAALSAIPPVAIILREMQRLDAARANPGVNLVYGVTPLRRYAMQIVMRMTRSHFHAFNTREEALAFLSEDLPAGQHFSLHDTP
ncbi:MAG: hypothetical protein JXN59_18365 [Anaerolineae bacterium]|nr:hypothetical protein [Anaerolineae bacterium]